MRSSTTAPHDAPPAFVVRAASAGDVRAIARLGAALVRLHHHFDALRFMLPEGVERGYERFLAAELDDEDAIILVAEAEKQGAVVGYIYGRIEGRNWSLLLDRHGELIDIYVDDGARNAGIAAALIEAMVGALALRGAPRVVLSVAVPNEGALRLFERAGFRRTMIEMTRETDASIAPKKSI